MVAQTQVELKTLLEVDEESAGFYNDMEGEDDVLHRRRIPARESVGSLESKQCAWASLPAPAKLLLALILVGGVVVGVWFAGRPADNDVVATPAWNWECSISIRLA